MILSNSCQKKSEVMAIKLNVLYDSQPIKVISLERDTSSGFLKLSLSLLLTERCQ